MIRDVLAGLLAALLLAYAARLARSLRGFRRLRERTRDSERALGRTIVAEIPSQEGDLLLFSEDDVRFYYGDRSIDKDLITAVRLLVNGEPVAVRVSSHAPPSSFHLPAFSLPHSSQGLPGPLRPPGAPGTEDGFVRQRWDVAIDTLSGPTIIPCGAIREGISQELARAVFAAVSREIERRDISDRERRDIK